GSSTSSRASTSWSPNLSFESCGRERLSDYFQVTVSILSSGTLSNTHEAFAALDEGRQQPVKGWGSTDARSSYGGSHLPVGGGSCGGGRQQSRDSQGHPYPGGG